MDGIDIFRGGLLFLRYFYGGIFMDDDDDDQSCLFSHVSLRPWRGKLRNMKSNIAIIFRFPSSRRQQQLIILFALCVVTSLMVLNSLLS